MNLKRMFMGLAIGAAFLLPFSASAMSPITDSELSAVTGQAGVSINLDARVDMYAKTVAWGDVDGFGKGAAATLNVGQAVATNDKANAGWVGLSELAISNLRVRADQTLLNAQWLADEYSAITPAHISAFSTAATNLGTALGTWLASPANIPPAGVSMHFKATDSSTWDAASLGAFADAGIALAEIGAFSAAKDAAVGDDADAMTYLAAGAKITAEADLGMLPDFAPLTIDVATGTGTANGEHGADVTFVRIGLGALEVWMDSLTSDVALGPNTALGSGIPDLKYVLGSLYIADLALRIDGASYIDIYTDRAPGTTQGVSIGVNATVKDFRVGTLAWGDADGIDWAFNLAGKLDTEDLDLETPGTGGALTSTPDPGWVGLKNLAIAKIQAIGTVDIDVATNTSGWSFVQLDLGADLASAFNIKLASMTATAALGADATSPTGLNQELGEIYLSNVDVKVYGALKIGARADGTQGVDIDLAQMTVGIQPLDVSWGDLDGITGAKRAGYVGLKALTINGLALQGKVSIDVATVSALAGNPANLTQMMYKGYVENNVSPTFVHIGLGSGDASTDGFDAGAITAGSLGVSITNLTANVVFANNAAMTANAGAGLAANTLGSVYVDTLKVGMNGWVDIAAH